MQEFNKLKYIPISKKEYQMFQNLEKMYFVEFTNELVNWADALFAIKSQIAYCKYTDNEETKIEYETMHSDFKNRIVKQLSELDLFDTIV